MEHGVGGGFGEPADHAGRVDQYREYSFDDERPHQCQAQRGGGVAQQQPEAGAEHAVEGGEQRHGDDRAGHPWLGPVQRHVVCGQRGGRGGHAERFDEQADRHAGQGGGGEFGGHDAQPPGLAEEGGDRGAVPELPGRQHDPGKQHGTVDELPARAAQQIGQHRGG